MISDEDCTASAILRISTAAFWMMPVPCSETVPASCEMPWASPALCET